jgi:hypothetical protein
VPGLAGELGGLPGQSGDDTAALRGEIFETVGVQGLVGLAQRLSQFQELPALLRPGAQQQVRRPGREGGAAVGMDPAGIVHPAGRFRSGGQRLPSGDEVGRRRGVELVEGGFHVVPSATPAAFARVQRLHTSGPPSCHSVHSDSMTSSSSLPVRPAFRRNTVRSWRL